MFASTNDKQRIINVVFFPEVAEKYQRELLVLDRKYVYVEIRLCEDLAALSTSITHAIPSNILIDGPDD